MGMYHGHAPPRPPEGDEIRSMLHMGGFGYHLPPDATVTLERVDDRFNAFGRTVKRRLYTVHVAFSLSAMLRAAEATYPHSREIGSRR